MVIKMENLQLLDITDDLLVLNKNTLESLFKLENSADCVALYLLYYKTAKWQKTDTVKANDSYVQKSLNWGRNKILKTKQALKNSGLIEIVQRRNNGKIDGWFIKIRYIVSQKKQEKIIVEQEVSKQEVSESTCGFEEINALRKNIICLKKKIEMLKEENNKIKILLKESTKESFDKFLFDKFWNAYPKKVSKGNVEKWFTKNKPSEDLVNEMITKINLLKETKQWKSDNGQYIPYPTTWLNAKGWEDEIQPTTKHEQHETREEECISERARRVFGSD